MHIFIMTLVLRGLSTQLKNWYMASCCYVILNWSCDWFTMTPLIFLSQAAALVQLFRPLLAPGKLKTASTICVLKNSNTSASHFLLVMVTAL